MKNLVTIIGLLLVSLTICRGKLRKSGDNRCKLEQSTDEVFCRMTLFFLLSRKHSRLFTQWAESFTMHYQFSEGAAASIRLGENWSKLCCSRAWAAFIRQVSSCWRILTGNCEITLLRNCNRKSHICDDNKPMFFSIKMERGQEFKAAFTNLLVSGPSNFNIEKLR